MFRCPVGSERYNGSYPNTTSNDTSCNETAYEPETTQTSSTCTTNLSALVYNEMCGSDVGCAEFDF